MTVTYTNSRLDAFRFGVQSAFSNRFFFGLLVIVPVLGGVRLARSLSESQPWPVVVVTVLVYLLTLGAVIFPSIALLTGALAAMVKNPGFFTEHVVKLDDKGVSEETSMGSQFVRWDGIVKLRKSQELIQIFIASNMAHLIPRRAFPDDSAFEEFYQTCRERMEAARTLEGGKP